MRQVRNYFPPGKLSLPLQIFSTALRLPGEGPPGYVPVPSQGLSRGWLSNSYPACAHLYYLSTFYTFKNTSRQGATLHHLLLKNCCLSNATVI